MALTIDETSTFDRLLRTAQSTYPADVRVGQYYEGEQRLDNLGLAVPPDLRRFTTFVNWPRVCVDSIEERLDVKSLILPGQTTGDAGLREGWDANNLDSEASLAHLDALIYGRTFVSVGANEDAPDVPLIRVESPREITAEIDPRTRRLMSALRLYGAQPDGTVVTSLPTLATLYMPDRTVWLERDVNSRWQVTGVDDHRLGRVSLVLFLNRRRAGNWVGVSEMADVIGLTDAAARALTNLQVAQETLAVPARYALGLSKGDFVDVDGNPLPVWQAYFGSIWSTANADAKVGQFSAADLRNFTETVNHYAQLVASTTGLPMRYLGQNTANPPSADGIRADESRLVKRAERKQRAFGDNWGWVLALYLRFRDGDWVDGNTISVDWHDAATPTVAARVDAVQKMTGGKPILSVEGAWDELGWSDAKKLRERDYLAAEAADPILSALTKEIGTGGDTAVGP